MTRIAVCVTGSARPNETLAVLRRHSGESLAVLAARMGAGEPALELALYGSDHDEVARRLRALVDELPRSGALVRLYELGDGETVETADPRVAEITPAVLHNLLESWDELEGQPD